MKLTDALRELERAGTAQNRKVYARHGVEEPMFGVGYAALGKLRKQVKTDHDLARQLWATGNHDARVFASMVADPQKVTSAELERWVKDLGNYVLTDAFSGVAAESPHALDKAERWIAARGEWTSTAGWNVVARLALEPGAVEPRQLERWLATIEKRLHRAPNRTRYAMNNALIAIGSNGGALAKKAVAAAKCIGPVEVDHGETGCKTPDAASYIAKVLERRAGHPPRTKSASGTRSTARSRPVKSSARARAE